MHDSLAIPALARPAPSESPFAVEVGPESTTTTFLLNLRQVAAAEQQQMVFAPPAEGIRGRNPLVRTDVFCPVLIFVVCSIL